MIQCLPLKVSLRSQDAIGYIIKGDCLTDYSDEFITKNFAMFKDRVQELENKLKEHILKNTHPEQSSEQSQTE